MALINCKECGHQVSSKSRACPSCGAIINKPKRSLLGKVIKWSFILFNILMIIWLVSFFKSWIQSVNNLTIDSYNYEDISELNDTTFNLGIGIFFIVGIWVVGDIVLGILTLLTRPK